MSSIVAIGTLIVDAYFRANADGPRSFLGYGFGGTAFNVLARLPDTWKKSFIYQSGTDGFSQGFSSQCEREGILPVPCLTTRPRCAQVLFRVLEDDTYPWCDNRFHKPCPICGRIPMDESVSVGSPSASEIEQLSNEIAGASILFVDRVNKGTQLAMQIAKKRGVLTIMDIGSLSFVRYVPTVRLKQFLGQCDILFASSPVVESLVRRMGSPDSSSLLSLGPKFMVELGGSSGLTLYSKRGESNEVALFPAPNVEVIRDTSGAGDAVISGVIKSLLETGVSHSAVVNGLNTGIERAADCIAQVGAREYLIGSIPGVSPVLVEYHRPDECPFSSPLTAELQISAARRRSVTSSNVSALWSRSLFSTESYPEMQKLARFIRESPGPILVSGTGGSSAAAAFVADMIRVETRKSAFRVFPRQSIESPVRGASMIGLSYSGRSTDVIHALKNNISQGGCSLLLTGNEKVIEAEGIEVVSYGKAGRSKERGFLSFVGTVSPSLFGCAALCGTSAVHELDVLVQNNMSSWRSLGIKIGAVVKAEPSVLHVIYDGPTHAAAVDLESKMAESGLLVVQLHEAKDFSHGRFVGVAAGSSLANAVLVLRTGRQNRYLSSLLKILRATDHTFFDLDFQGAPTIVSATSLVATQYIFDGIARRLGVDPSRPRLKNREFLRLYRWPHNPAF